MFEFARVDWDRIVENKSLLRRLDPESSLLEYVSICELSETGSIIGYFNFHGNLEMENAFCEDVSLKMESSTQGWEMMQYYDRALQEEVAKYLPCRI